MRPSCLVGFVSVLALAAVSAASLAQSPQPAPPGYRIIVHPNNPAATLDRRFLEDAFLRKIKTWPGGEAIRPVDLEPDSAVRRRFTEEVVRRPVAAVRAYWQKLIFSGRDVPPPTLDTDPDVIKYVMKFPGAIGYVSGTAALHGVKVVTIR